MKGVKAAAKGAKVIKGKDLPDEYMGSKYTHKLKGGNAKANDGKMYLYDILDIKKETSNPFES